MKQALHLAATEVHVEHLLAAGKTARSLGRWLRAVAARDARRPAAAEVTYLASAQAVAAIGDRLGDEASPALVRSLDDALGELRRAGVQAADLEKSAAPRARLYGALLRHSDAILARAGLFDERAIGWIAAAALETADTAELPSAAIVEGLFSWDESSFAWVEALARRIPVTVRMPRLGGAVTSLFTEMVPAPDVLLAQLEARWQDLSSAPDLELVAIEPPADLHLIEGANEGAEARAIAAVVARAIAADTPADRIAILVPQLDETFIGPLRAALREARVIFEEPRGRALVGPDALGARLFAAPAPRAALGWLDFVAGPLDRDALLDLLTMNVVDPLPFIDQAHLAERQKLALALARRLSRLPARCDRQGSLLLNLLKADIAEQPEDRWMVEALARIVKVRRELGRGAPRGVLCAEFFDLFASLGLLDAGERKVADFLAAAPGGPEAELFRQGAEEQAQGMRALFDAARRLEGAAIALGFAEEPVTARAFRAELHAALTSGASGATRRPGSVRVMRAADAAWIPTALLVVTRASQGSFEADDADHLAEDEDLFAKAARPSRWRRAARRTEIWAAIGSASRVVVTRAKVDGEGHPVPPSGLFAELAAARPVEEEAASPFVVGASSLSPRRSELSALHHGARPSDADVERRALIESVRQDFFLHPERLATPETGAVDFGTPGARDHILRAFGGTRERPIAATTIELAALCRFAAFATRVLGASYAESASEELDPRSRGSLVHRALRMALETMQKERQRQPERVALLSSVMDKVEREFIGPKSAPLYRAEVQRALRDVAAVLEWSLDDASDFQFALAERTFGDRPVGAKSAGWPPVVIGPPQKRVFVRGRIDRVDESRDRTRLRIIDYKSGALPAWKDVGRLLFQPPLYAYAALWEKGPLGLAEVRALYLDTSKRPPKPLPAGQGQVLSSADIEAAQVRAAEIVALLQGGDVAPRPADAAVCSRCDVRSVCRRPAALPIEDLDVEGEEQSS